MVLFWHNLFTQGAAARNISLNIQYWMVMKSIRIGGQIKTFGRQIGMAKRLGKAYENIENSVLEELVVTDTIPTKPSKKIKTLTVSNLFAKAIRKIHDHESISSLFIR